MKVHVASRKSATLDFPIEGHDEQRFSIRDQEAENNERTDNREWFADILRTHESKNDPRQQRQDTSRLLQRAKAQQVALLGFQGRLTKMLPDEFKDVTMSERNAALRKCLYIPFHL